MNSSIVQIANYKTSIPSSKFAPKEQVVSILPSINECMAILPRSVGNHILSYTTAFLDFYIENMILKYGVIFVWKVLSNLLNIKEFVSWTKYRITQELPKYIRMVKKHPYIKRNMIMIKFNLHIDQRRTRIQLEQQQKLLYQQQIQDIYSKVQTGDIIRFHKQWNTNFATEKFCLIVEKTKKCYYSIRINVGNNLESDFYCINVAFIYHIFNRNEFGLPTEISIERNVLIENENIEFLPRKELRLSPSFKPLTLWSKKNDIMKQFGYTQVGNTFDYNSV
jgi:hypothetical protein